MQRVLDDVHQRAGQQRAVERHDWAARGELRLDADASGRCGTVWLQDLRDDVVELCRRQLRHRRGGKTRELGGDLPEQPHLRQDGGDARLEHGRQRLTAVVVHPQQVLGRQLNRRQRVLDVVRHLSGHLGPRFEAVRPLELAALPLQVGSHPVERLDEAPELVGRRDGNPRVEIAMRDATRCAREPVHRVRNALGHRVAHRRAEQDEAHRREQHTAIERVDLALGLLLAQRERHGDDGAQLSLTDRCRGHEVFERADLLLADVAGLPLEEDRLICLRRRAGGQTSRREEVTLARGDQPRSREDVHVFVDDAADATIISSVNSGRRAAAPLLRDDALHHPSGHRHRAARLRSRYRRAVRRRRTCGSGTPARARARRRRPRTRGTACGRSCRESRAAARGPVTALYPPSAARGPRVEEQRDVGHARERRDLGESHQVIDRPRQRVAERVDARPIVQEQHLVRCGRRGAPAPRAGDSWRGRCARAARC